jgi:hypothetical protein
MQSNTIIHICIVKRCFYMASLNNMFRPLYQPSSGCTFSVFVNEILCTSTKPAFKIIAVAVELKSYSEIKDVCVCETIHPPPPPPPPRPPPSLFFFFFFFFEFFFIIASLSGKKKGFLEIPPFWHKTPPPPPPPEITHPTFYTVYIFYVRVTF